MADYDYISKKDQKQFAHIIPDRDTSYDIRPAWKRFDDKLEEDAVGLWQKFGVLPTGVSPADRVDEICVVGYKDDKPVGLMTARIGRLPLLEETFFFMRTFVVPEHREHDLARWMMVDAKEILADWSKEHPEEKVMGMVTIVQSRVMQHSELVRYPRWPQVGMNLIAYTTEGDQVRMVWFDHALLAKPDS